MTDATTVSEAAAAAPHAPKAKGPLGALYNWVIRLAGGKQAAFKFLNALKIIKISNNLGDAKSLITHPSTTTHQRLSEEARLEQGHIATELVDDEPGDQRLVACGRRGSLDAGACQR